jgi:beta-glucanase (GH16 family)
MRWLRGAVISAVLTAAYVLAPSAARASSQPTPDGVPASEVGVLIQQREPGHGDNLDTWHLNPADAGGCTGGYDAYEVVAGTPLLYVFTSATDCAEIQSPGYYNQGIFEARIYFRAAPGTTKIADWPSFWLANQGPGGWPADGEIDVAEALDGCLTENYHGGTLIRPGVASYNENGGCLGIGAGWHTVDVVWAGHTVTYYVDGRQGRSYTSPSISDAPEQMMFTLTCGQFSGPCLSTDSDALQYVRVWTVR